MTLPVWICSLFRPVRIAKLPRKKTRALAVEKLEERVVLYSVTGNAWPNPQEITISFMPDGTQLSSGAGSSVTSNLFSAFNAKFGGAAAWQNQILKAAQLWAQQTNINFVVVADNGAPSGSGSYQQGDPGFGDIRIGGYAFGNSTLAAAFQPPPVNNYSIAGDVAFNTSQAYNVGSTYDLFTVAVHELGHSLGLDHSSASTSSVMYPSYTSVKSALTADDIAGIRNIYSANAPRSADGYDSAASNNTAATASNINSLINPSTLTADTGLEDITTTSDVDYYTFTAPQQTGGTLQVQVQSQGLSLLSPKVTVYAADGSTVLGSASGLNKYGTTLTVPVKGVTAGQQFYVKVQGADSTAFGTGVYDLALNFGTAATPVAASTASRTVKGSTTSGGGGVADNPNGVDQLLGSTPLITGISPDSGGSSNDGVTNTSHVAFSGTGPLLTFIGIYKAGANGAPGQLVGTTLTVGTVWNFDYSRQTLPDGPSIFYIRTTDLFGRVGQPSMTFTVTVDTVAPKQLSVAGISGANTASPTLLGSAEANSTVTIYTNGVQVGTTQADSLGNWQYATGQLAGGHYAFQATATDLAGNVSPVSAAYNLTVGTKAPGSPVVTGVTPGGLVGTADPNARVQVSTGGVNLGSTTSDAQGFWQLGLIGGLLPGAYSLLVQAVDSAGNSSSSPFRLLVGPSTSYLASLQQVLASVSPGSGLFPSSGLQQTATSDVSTVLAGWTGTSYLTAGGNATGSWSFTGAASTEPTSVVSLATDLVAADVFLCDLLGLGL